MYPHPEQRTDEKWVGNTRKNEWPETELATLKTARIGAVAYDIDGKPIPPEHYRPLFIGRDELDAYDRIRMAEFSAIRGGRTA